MSCRRIPSPFHRALDPCSRSHSHSLQMLSSYSFAVIWLLSAVAIARGQFTDEHLRQLQGLKCDQPSVTLHVFSGTQNPVWNIDAKQLVSIQTVANDLWRPTNNVSLFSKATKRIMGYQGFTISCSEDESVFVHGLSPLERILLVAGRRFLSPSVTLHVKDHLGEIMAATPCVESPNADCNHAPIKGPDTVPQYDPSSDDQGCFVKKQSDNNCYAYGKTISFALVHIHLLFCRH